MAFMHTQLLLCQVFINCDNSVVASHFLLAFMAVDACIAQTAVFISLELIYGIVHQRLVEHIQAYQQGKVMLGKASDALKKHRLQLQYHVFSENGYTL